MRHGSVALVAGLWLVCAAAEAAEPGSGESSFWPRLDFEWYGYVKLDLAYDGSKTTPGEFAKWAVPAPADDEVSLTLNQTRLGLRVRGPEMRVRGGGRVEIDFYGHVDDPDPRIRHAYLELGWPEADFDLIVGQTSDVISPLNPSTLNYTVAWWAGNIGFRRPQIRMTKRFDAGGDAELQVEGALTHNIYDTRAGSVSGEDAGLAVQGRVAYSFAGFGAGSGSGPVTVGLSGHRAEETFPLDGRAGRCDSWSANLDLSMPLTDTLRLTSELFTGKSLSPYLGGIGQGVDPEDLHGVHSRGGWLALSLVPHGLPRISAGVSVDDVDGADLEPGSRELNRSLFANVIYPLNRQVDLGLELSYWTTRYKDSGDCDALRAQVSFVHRF